MLLSFGYLDVKSSELTVTCTKIGWQKRGESHNLELCTPNIGCDLSKVILLKDRKHSVKHCSKVASSSKTLSTLIHRKNKR